MLKKAVNEKVTGKCSFILLLLCPKVFGFQLFCASFFRWIQTHHLVYDSLLFFCKLVSALFANFKAKPERKCSKTYYINVSLNPHFTSTSGLGGSFFWKKRSNLFPKSIMSILKAWLWVYATISIYSHYYWPVSAMQNYRTSYIKIWRHKCKYLARKTSIPGFFLSKIWHKQSKG